MLSRLKDWLCSLWERHLLKPVDSFRENKQIEQTLEIRGVIDVTDSTWCARLQAPPSHVDFAFNTFWGKEKVNFGPKRGQVMI